MLPSKYTHDLKSTWPAQLEMINNVTMYYVTAGDVGI